MTTPDRMEKINIDQLVRYLKNMKKQLSYCADPYATPEDLLTRLEESLDTLIEDFETPKVDNTK